MSIEGLIIAFVALLLWGLWVALPILRATLRPSPASGSTAHERVEERQRERLGVFYEQALRNIRDLDEDYATGKLSGEEYHAERSLWTERGVALLKALDSLHTQGIMTVRDGDPSAAVLPVNADDATIDAAIEAAIAAFRDKNQQSNHA